LRAPRIKQPWRPKLGWSFWLVAPAVTILVIAGWASAGVSGFLVMAGVAALITSLYSLVTGRSGWASVPGRKAAAIVLAASVVVTGVGGATVPRQEPAPLAFTDESAVDPEEVTAPEQPAEVAIPDASVTDTTALALLDTLPIKGKSPITGYERTDKFGAAWLDVDRNGCDTRNDILARDFTEVTKSGACKVTHGLLVSPYSGDSVDFVRGSETSMAVQVDHVVALANAWQTGAQKLSQAQRVALANDPINLFAVEGKSNQQKGAGDTATWLPSAKSFRCTYVAHQVSVKATYGLWVTPAEHDAMSRVLSVCPDQPAVTSSFAPEPAPAPVSAPAEPATVHPGSYCSNAGATGVTMKGTLMACTTTTTDAQLRWRSV
jgi:hypothetical protein